MAGMLNEGVRLRTAAGEPVAITGFIGAGGQGEVYRVEHRGRNRALKWYYPQAATPLQRQIVEDLVDRDIADDRFLWPSDMVVEGETAFGYLMALRPARFRGLPALFRRELMITPRELLTACIHLVEAYRALHGQGIAYRDISYGNVFLDPGTGDILVCDNDNAVVEGMDSGIAGTMEFMAPELVRQDEGAVPGTQTDLHSLAVLLFMILMNGHPLEGAREYAIHCLEENARRRLYGTQPVFVFDPDDDSNRPMAGTHDSVLATWPVLSADLRSLFGRAFTVGLRAAERRVRESEWRDALSGARDLLLTCPRCARLNMSDGETHSCWSCHEPLGDTPRLRITTVNPAAVREVRLIPAAGVYAHHLVAEPDRHDFAAPLATVVEHPQVSGRYGLHNLSGEPWSLRRPDGTTDEVPPGRSVEIKGGFELRLAGVHARIDAPGCAL